MVFSAKKHCIRRKIFGDYRPYSPKSRIFAENLRQCTYMNTRNGGTLDMTPRLF